VLISKLTEGHTSRYWNIDTSNSHPPPLPWWGNHEEGWFRRGKVYDKKKRKK
jgi:hypothetical protein